MRYDDVVAHTVVRCLLAVVLAAGAVSGYEPTLTPQGVADALAIGQSYMESGRVDYHQPYRIQVGRPPVDYIDIVTPFRRLELAAEERARAGNRVFGQRDAAAVLAEHGGRLQLFVELTFHPLNTFVGVPSYGVTLARADARVEALDIQRIPRFGARRDGNSLPYATAPVLPPGSQPMLGGTLVVSYDSRRLDPRGVYDVVIEESGTALARASVDLGKLR